MNFREPTSLLSAGFKSAAQAQFQAELDAARAKREDARNLRTAVICGVLIGLTVCAVRVALGL